MLKIRTRIAVFCARWVHRAIRLLHLGAGAALPGAVARRIDPGILGKLAGMVSQGILVVMGTNGKTTVNSLLYQAMRAEGKEVVSNGTGANMENGIITAFVLAAGKKGRLLADYACIEVDENAAPALVPKLMPDVIVLTNLFRDQLDRYGEVDVVYGRIKSAVSRAPEAVVVYNCDDALLSVLPSGCPNRTVAYGIEERLFDEVARHGVRESVFCRFCGQKLRYDLIQYGHLGIYHCPGCGWKRPRPDYRARHIRTEHEFCYLELDKKTIRPRISAMYQVYNILSAYAALKAMDAPTASFGSTAENFDYDNHRESRFYIDGASVQIYLAKNPVGFQQKLSLLCADAGQKDLLILINDTAQDGRDVSWLWDVDFQYLEKAHASTIVVGGRRRYDMGLRLKYEGIPCEVAEHVPGAIRRLIRTGTRNLYLLVNYSSLYPVNRMLTRWEKTQNTDLWKEDDDI